MLQKTSCIVPSDCGNIKLLKIMQVYRYKNNIFGIMEKFCKCIIKKVTPKYKRLRKSKTRGIIIRSNIFFFKLDGIGIKFINNAVIPLKRRMNPWNKKLIGPTLTSFRLKKFRSGLSQIICSYRLVVRTVGFHPTNSGSNPDKNI